MGGHSLAKLGRSERVTASASHSVEGSAVTPKHRLLLAYVCHIHPLCDPGLGSPEPWVLGLQGDGLKAEPDE